MANDYVLVEAIQLIKAGKKEAARVMLERYLQRNPDNIHAWMWEAETFPDDADKIRVLEACLRNNPGNPQASQALDFLKKRAAPKPAPFTASPFTETPFTDASSSASSVSPFIDSPFEQSPFEAPPPPPVKKPLPFVTDSSAAPKSVSPFTTVSPFLSEDSAPFVSESAKQPLPEAPQAEKDETPAKKPARKTSKKTQIAVVVGAIVFFLLLVGGYIGGGAYLNGQINAAFAAGRCEAVLQHGSIFALYPRALFSFWFDGYDQYAQCDLKLKADSAAAAQDWASALTFSQQYAALYPQGAFAAGMGELAIHAHLNWAQDLLARQNYAGAIEKSKQFIETYPDHPANAALRDEILQAYLDWAKGFFNAQDYLSAETYLRDGLTYFEADAARSLKLKAELTRLYIAWGDFQTAINNLEKAAEYYRRAGEFSPDGVDVDLLIAKAYLKQALEIADKNDFNRALTKVFEIEAAAQAENIKAEAAAARELILQKYSASSSIQATEQMQLAIPAVCGGEKPALPIFGLDENAVRAALFSAVIIPLPADVSASTPGQLRYVACANEVEKEIGSCSYPGGTLYRLRYDWDVALYDAQTMSAKTSTTLRGGDPPECPKKETFPKGVSAKKSYGNKPTAEQVAEWLRTLGLLK